LFIKNINQTSQLEHLKVAIKTQGEETSHLINQHLTIVFNMNSN